MIIVNGLPIHSKCITRDRAPHTVITYGPKFDERVSCGYGATEAEQFQHAMEKIKARGCKVENVDVLPPVVKDKRFSHPISYVEDKCTRCEKPGLFNKANIYRAHYCEECRLEVKREKNKRHYQNEKRNAIIEALQ